MIMQYTEDYHHFGYPTDDMKATEDFYTSLGFKLRWETPGDDNKVKFFQYGDIMVEVYTGTPAKKYGSIDHMAFNCTDITACCKAIKDQGFKIVDGPTFLPFLEHGVLYIMIEGPNVEKLEFVQEFRSEDEKEKHCAALGI